MTNIELLKNAIDWKFFNYLKDKVTYFEDNGYKVTIDIWSPVENKNYEVKVYYYTEYKEEFNPHIPENTKFKLEFEYVVEIIDASKSDKIKFYNSIKDKCIVEHQAENYAIISVVPKPK